MITFLKRLLCKHRNLKFVRNVYGDEINYLSRWKSTVRSIYRCQACGSTVFKSELYLPGEVALLPIDILPVRTTPPNELPRQGDLYWDVFQHCYQYYDDGGWRVVERGGEA